VAGEGIAVVGWRSGGYVGVLLVAFGASLWGTDAILRVPLLEKMSPPAIVLSEHLVLLLYSVPAVVLGRFVLKDMPFYTLTGARLLTALPLLVVIVLAQGSFVEVGAGFSAQPERLVLLALIPGLVALLLYYRGLTSTRASYATLAELTFPATAVVLNWVFLGMTVNANQIVGFLLLWEAVFILSYLNSRVPAPEPLSTMVGTGRAG
jgi:uncharacterized membrane protein